jgi:3-phosphoshikimate 1-carboxyvinyltransferase
MQTWPAPRATKPVVATVPLPGSKSASNRALILAALANGPSHLTGVLHARDTALMMDALRALGASFETSPAIDPGNLDVVVHPIPTDATCTGTIDVGLAGTVMRFVPALVGLVQGSITFDGDAQARERPMATTIEALQQLGLQVTGTHTLPFTVHGTGGIEGGTIRIDASKSSQFLSALLLIGARTAQGVRIEHVGDVLPSQPHIDMTLEMLQAHGVDVQVEGDRIWQVAAGGVHPVDHVIEPDLSNAAPFLAAALVTEGSVTVPNWPRRTTQAGDALRDYLTQMGADVQWTTDGLTVSMDGPITGLTADLSDVGELTPTLAALAALSDSPSTLTGIAHLRGHETDRIAALVHEITHLGGVAEELSDGIRIRPAILHPGIWQSYADHRMATAGAVLGLHVPGLSVADIECTQKTMPDFPERWHAMLAGTHGT